MEVMDECRLRLARAGRGWALEEVMATASEWDSMTRGRGARSIVGGVRGGESRYYYAGAHPDEGEV
jgi:hypothetical protein